jgi:hypothetical protein
MESILNHAAVGIHISSSAIPEFGILHHSPTDIYISSSAVPELGAFDVLKALAVFYN